MTCREFLHFVDAVPLRLRSDRELRIARQHATACPRCAVLLSEAESLEQAFGSLPTIASTDRLVANVMERVRMEGPERPAVRRPAAETRLDEAQIPVAQVILGKSWIRVGMFRARVVRVRSSSMSRLPAA